MGVSVVAAAARAEASRSVREIWKDCEPGSLQARVKATALTREMDGGFEAGVAVETGGAETGGTGGVRGTAGESLDRGGIASHRGPAGGDVDGGTLSCEEVRKVICLKAQSINGLCRVSQFNPSTIGQEVSSGVT